MPKTQIDMPRPEYMDMLNDWELCRDLMGGTRAMWESGTRWLPQWSPVEQNMDYESRLKETILFNAFGRAVRTLTGKVFVDPIEISEDTPEQILGWYDNIDLTGRDLSTFARACFEDALQTGLTHILVDRPSTVAANRGEEISLGIRPYCVHIPAESLVWWFVDTIDGIEQVVEVRILEEVIEPDGWGLRTRKRIRRLLIGQYEVWEETESQQGVTWLPIEAGETGLNYIPLVTIYFDRRAMMEANPPLLDLAHLNLAHWRGQSLQTHVLSLGRRPVPYLLGFDPAKVSRVEVGPHSGLVTEKTDAKVGFAEITGASTSAGRDALNDLKDEMAAMSVELLIRRPGEKTATQTEIQTEESNSELGAMATAMGKGLTRAAEILAEMSSLPEGGTIKIPTDFELDSATQDEIKDLIEMRRATPPLISRHRFLSELKRRELFDDDFDVEEEMALLDVETTSLTTPPTEEE